jgi:hypothetical protein
MAPPPPNLALSRATPSKVAKIARLKAGATLADGNIYLGKLIFASS